MEQPWKCHRPGWPYSQGDHASKDLCHCRPGFQVREMSTHCTAVQVWFGLHRCRKTSHTFKGWESLNLQLSQQVRLRDGGAPFGGNEQCLPSQQRQRRANYGFRPTTGILSQPSQPPNMYYVRTCQQQGQPGSPRDSRGHEQCRIRELVFTLLQSPSCHPGKTALKQSNFLEETVSQSWEDPCWKLQSSSLLACLGRKPKMARVLGLQYLQERPG